MVGSWTGPLLDEAPEDAGIVQQSNEVGEVLVPALDQSSGRVFSGCECPAQEVEQVERGLRASAFGCVYLKMLRDPIPEAIRRLRSKFRAENVSAV